MHTAQSYRLNRNGLNIVSMAAAILAMSALGDVAQARQALSDSETGAWIIEFETPPLMQQLRDQGQAMANLNMASDSMKQRVAAIEYQVEQQRQILAKQMAMELEPLHHYQVSFSGFASEMSREQAEQILQMPGVKAVYPDVKYVYQLDAGPLWIGAPGIWNGPNGLRSQGEGVVVGVIDGGINWAHPFFGQVGSDGYIHSNPRGQQFGLCSDPTVNCNDKLIGVYDYTTEGSNGRSVSDHGSHVASIATGNRLTLSFSLPGGTSTFTLAGVAPHANVISYKVCESGEGNSAGSCSGAAIIDAIEQAILDQVDVINISLGTSQPIPELPWRLPIPQVELDAREAGIIIAVAAGNLGSQPGTVSSSGHSPWVIAAGNSTHNRIIGQTLTALSGGDTTPPPDLVGAGNTLGTATRRIVHAADFGFPLCGTGTAELRTGCGPASDDALMGLSNPFAPNTFNGEIVVCDRGQYGRVEKGFNVMAAGAGGMILANTDEQGIEIISDTHCLPAVHIDSEQGDELRTWLATGDNHLGRITATSRVLNDSLGNQIVASSSRGPNPEIAGVVKPNLMAPGSNIIGASADETMVAFLTGTSMASPHIAGSAALLLGVNPSWSPAIVQSTLETTASNDVIQVGAEAAPINSRGAGLVQPTSAVNAGLYLDISASEFRAANPAIGGQPMAMNMALMQNPDCLESCSFTRRVTDLQGGGSWTVSTEGELPLSVTPSQFTLGNGQSQSLQIQVDTTNPSFFGRWIDGAVVLESPGAPTQRLQVTVMASGGELPELVQLQTTATRGNAQIPFDDLARITLGQWDASTLTEAELVQFNSVQQDPTRFDPYDTPTGTVWEIHQVPANTALLVAQVNQSNASDIDLYVGIDSNGNGAPDSFEQRCSSTSLSVSERCVLSMPEAGQYWVMYQNWDSGSSAVNNISGETAVVSAINQGNFFVNGPGVVAPGDDFNLDIAWDEGRISRNSAWWGAIAMGTDSGNPANLGLLPIRLTRSSDDPGNTLPLFSGRQRSITLGENSEHSRMFIDVPPGAESLNVMMSTESLNISGGLALAPVSFDDAFADEPFVSLAPATRPFSRSLSNGQASLTVTGSDLTPGRWYVIPGNNSVQELQLDITARITMGNTGFTPERNSFGPINRDISQGIEYNRVGNNFGVAFFTYARNGAPVTYLGAGALTQNDSVLAHGPLNAFIGIPGDQAGMPVGYIGMTFISAQEVILSYDLMGESGSERLGTIAQLTCPDRNGQELNVTGHWTPQTLGGGGTALLVNQNNQAYVFYFFDNDGIQRWLLANSPDNYLTDPVADARQFRGFCPTCSPGSTGQDIVGTITHQFNDDNSGQQTVSVSLAQPLMGELQFSRDLFKLTDTNDCQ